MSIKILLYGRVFILKTMINFYFSLFIVFFCILPNRRDKLEEFVRIKNN